MLTLKVIRRRIRSSTKIQQITRTMQMVAASRLRRSEEKLRQIRPFSGAMEEVLAHLGRSPDLPFHPFFASRARKKSVVVVLTSDRGLCGAYNMNLLLQAERFLRGFPPGQAALILVGKKGCDYFKRRRVEILGHFIDLGGKPDLRTMKPVAECISSTFLSGAADEVSLLYTAYRSAFSYKPTLTRFLPIEKMASASGGSGQLDFIWEPGLAAILDAFLPRYIETKLYHCLMESATSENSARMIAMKNATDNAGEMIDSLTLQRNKARQAAITKEISEIVTAAEALR